MEHPPEDDQANRLKTASVLGTSSSYVYDGDGKRASKTVGSTPTNHVYDVNASLPVLLDDGTRKYVWGLGLALAVDAPGSPIVYHTDGLGSVRVLTDSVDSVARRCHAVRPYFGRLPVIFFTNRWQAWPKPTGSANIIGHAPSTTEMPCPRPYFTASGETAPFPSQTRGIPAAEQPRITSSVASGGSITIAPSTGQGSCSTLG